MDGRRPHHAPWGVRHRATRGSHGLGPWALRTWARFASLLSRIAGRVGGSLNDGPRDAAARAQQLPSKPAVAHGPRAGFALVEWMVLVVLALVLAALFLPALLKVRRIAGTSACLARIRWMASAMDLYATDHDDRFPPNLDGPGIPLGQTWVQGWMGAPGPDCTNLASLRQSLLAPYLHNTTPWQCPAAGAVTLGSARVTKVRSFSINGFVGSPVVSPAAATFRKRSDLGSIEPSALLGFIEERPEGIDDGTFALPWTFDRRRPQSWRFRDQPAVHHGSAANLSWLDGHAETHRWRHLSPAAVPRPGQPVPGHLDVLWLQQHGTSRTPSEPIAAQAPPQAPPSTPE